jgi:hypothetical protein
MTDYQKSAALAYTFCGVSALVFFAGLIVVIFDHIDLGLLITGIGALFLLISYLWMKYTGGRAKIEKQKDW